MILTIPSNKIAHHLIGFAFIFYFSRSVKVFPMATVFDIDVDVEKHYVYPSLDDVFMK